MRKIILLCTLFATTCGLWAAVTQVEVKKVSQSGNTILLNTGSYAGLKVNDRAKLVFQETMDGGEYQEVATVELIKNYPNYSYWRVLEDLMEDGLVAGLRLVLIPYQDVLKGKRAFHFYRKKVIVQDQEAIDRYKKQYDSDEGDVPVYEKRGHDYYINRVYDENFDPDREVRATIGTYKISPRGKFRLDEYADDLQLKESPDQDMQVDQKKEQLVAQGNTVSGYIAATGHRLEDVTNNDLETLEELFKKEKNIQESEGSLAAREQHKRITQIAYRQRNKINKRLDPMWSATMDEKSIRRYYIKSGFKEEIKRQQHALNNKQGHELYVRYTFDATDNIPKKDAVALQGMSHSLGIGFGYHLSKTGDALKNWVFNAFFQAADDYYSMGISNFKSTEKTMAFHLDYYLFGSPDVIGSYSWFVGAGFKLGKTELASGDVPGIFAYDIRSFQSLRIGFRYRFDGGDEVDKIIKVGYGFSALATYESVTLSAADFGKIPGEMYARTTVSDYRVSMGFDFYF